MASIMFPIQHLFPKGDYKKACKGDRSLTPIYLIAQQQKIETICEQYEKYHKDPSYAEPRFKLTALAVATMMGNHPVMQYLLNKKVNRAPVDQGGLTPLHYACALGDVESMKLLGETRRVYEIFPGWKKVINPPIPNGAAVVTCRNDTSVTAQQFLDSTGARFYDGIAASPQQFVNLLAKRLMEKKPDLIEGYLLQQFAQFEAHPPQLYFGPQGNAGDGVFAGEEIEPGSICAVYGGDARVHFDPSIRTYGEYVFGDVDGTKTRNCGTLSNDSFPNAFFWPLYLPDGRIHYVLFSVTKIKKGAPIFHNYSLDHNIKLKNVHQELNVQEMEAYFSEKPFPGLISSLSSIKHEGGVIGPHEMLRYLAVKVRLSYLLHTPSSTLHLFLKGILSKEDLVLLNDYRVLELLGSNKYPSLLRQYGGFYSSIERLSKIFEENSPESRRLKEILLGCLEQHPFHAITWFCSYLASFLQTGGDSWKKDLEHYPSVMKAVAYFSKLYALPPTKKIDQAEFERASRQLDQTVSLKLHLGMELFMQQHPNQSRLTPLSSLYFRMPGR